MGERLGVFIGLYVEFGMKFQSIAYLLRGSEYIYRICGQLIFKNLKAFFLNQVRYAGVVRWNKIK